MRILPVLLSIFMVGLLVSCQGSNKTSDGNSGKTIHNTSGKVLNVVATTGQIYDAVINICEDRVNAVNIMGPGINPHSYQPTESDISILSQADLIFWNGLHLEAQMSRILKKFQNAYPVTMDMPHDMLLKWDASSSSSEESDPHVWNDPELWSYAITKISDVLIQKIPEHADLFKANTKAYIDKVNEMDQWIRNQILSIPENIRVVITSHDAFNYYGKRYQIDMIGIQGISTESEAGTKDIQDLAQLIITKNVPTIFMESVVNPKLTEALIEAVKAKGGSITIGGELYSDALGEKGSKAETYMGMLRHNTSTIVKALTKKE